MVLRIPKHARIPYKPARPKDAPESVQHQSPQHTSADTADAHDEDDTHADNEAGSKCGETVGKEIGEYGGRGGRDSRLGANGNKPSTTINRESSAASTTPLCREAFLEPQYAIRFKDYIIGGNKNDQCFCVGHQ